MVLTCRLNVNLIRRVQKFRVGGLSVGIVTRIARLTFYILRNITFLGPTPKILWYGMAPIAQVLQLNAHLKMSPGRVALIAGRPVPLYSGLEL